MNAMPQRQTLRFAYLTAVMLGAAVAQVGRAEASTISIPASAAAVREVSDDNGDGLGDNLGSLVVFATAGVDRDSDSVPGTVRTQFEWDISTLTPADVGMAKVVLTTNQGSTDELDTQFYAGQADQDGSAAASDFQALADLIPDAVMPVAGEPFDIGTFEFDVTDFLEGALQAGHTHFSVQGRVDESLAGSGSARGLQVFSAHPNVPLIGGAVPMLVVDPIPEPASLALLGLGGLALLLGRRRQRNTQR